MLIRFVYSSFEVTVPSTDAFFVSFVINSVLVGVVRPTRLNTLGFVHKRGGNDVGYLKHGFDSKSYIVSLTSNFLLWELLGSVS